MDELKTRSFRVSEEVSTKLKELCENFDNRIVCVNQCL